MLHIARSIERRFPAWGPRIVRGLLLASALLAAAGIAGLAAP